jgi:WD40 repeat protein
MTKEAVTMNLWRSILFIISLGILSSRASAQADAVSLFAVDWHPDGVTGLAWHPIEDVLAVSGQLNNQPTVYLLAANAPPTLFVMTDTPPSDLVWSPDGTLLAGRTGTSTGDLIHVWSLSEQTEVLSIALMGATTTYQMGWSSDSTKLTYVRGNSIIVWDVLRNEQLAEHEFSNNSVTQAFAWQPSINLLWIAGADQQLRLWDIARNQFELEMAIDKFVTALSSSSDGSIMAIGASDGSVTVWNTATRQPITTFQAMQEDAVWIVEWSADGAHLAVAGSDDPIVIWDRHHEAIVDRIPRQTNGFFEAVAFSPYSGRLAYSTNSFGIGAAPLQPNLTDRTIQSFFGDVLQFVVPAPSMERLESITAACGLPADTEPATGLTAFTAQVAALPDTQIAPGCRADLLAVAAALQAAEGS